MISRRKSHLICRISREHAPGEPEEERLILSQAVPREHYPSLFPNPATVAWTPVDAIMQSLSQLYSDNYEVPFTASWDTFEETGLVSWEVVELGRVPGKFQLGCFTDGQDIATDEPIYAATFDLNGGTGWTTGALGINSFSSDTTPENERKRVYYRWFPAHLRPRCV